MTKPSIPISKTKIIVPNRRRELLKRPRLLDKMNKDLENKLILLSAPAGYGKTSLLIDLAHQAKVPVCWLTLDPLDRDPQRFMAYLIASLAERFPKVGEASQPLLNNLKSIESDSETLLVTLTNELYEQTEGDYFVIIDDFHIVDDVLVISSLVTRFLQLVDENCHLIISSRTLPELEDVSLMVAREQVKGLNQADLAFEPGEIQALYSQNHRKYLPEDRASELVEKTGGWITGIVLSDSTEVQISGAGTFDYLGKQVLDQQPRHVREFLLRTCLPEEFNAEFCEIVLGPFYGAPQNWLSLMGFILDKNLFVLPLEDGRWLRYHPLFREFLQTRLREELPEDIPPILERMVTAHEAAGEWEKAYYTCKQLNDPNALAELIERAGTPMLQTALVTLEGWINSLPPAIVRSKPGLISLRGMVSAMKGYLPEAKALLDMAVETYQKGQNQKGLALALVRRAHALRLLGNYEDSIKDVNGALEIAETDMSMQALYAEALRIRGLNSFRLGHSRNSVDDLEHSLHLYSELKETGSVSLLLVETAMVRAAIGDVDAAKNLYQEALNRLRREKNFRTQAETLNNLAVLYLQLGEYEFASDTFEEGLVCARNSRNQHAEALILAGLGDLYTETEEFGAAERAYEQADVVAGDSSAAFISNYLILARANLALIKNETELADTLLKQFRKKLKINPSGYERGLWALLEGRLCFLTGDYRKAIVHLNDGKSRFLQDGREAEYCWSVIWLMATYNQCGEKEKVRVEFRELMDAPSVSNHALTIALFQAFNWLTALQADAEIGRQLGGLLDKARQLNTRMPSVRRILRRLAQSIQMPTASIKIRALGRAEVVVNGKAVNVSDWRTQSVRDLFFYFLFIQEPVTKEQVAEVLWPEIDDPDTLKTRFKQGVYWLRRAAGRSAILFEDDYYRFNRGMDYEYDVEAFESYLKKAYQTRDVIERLSLYRKAVGLVDGPFLADLDADWVLIERERLGRIYRAALDELAQLYLDTNQIQECLEICEKALAEDRFNETIYMVEMRAHAALSDRSAVVRLYQEYKTMLMDEMRLEPSDEMNKIYQEIILR
jgi:ATP/maltotriose-dependent transcriptional regulator MalT/DNA-binding SARP family transcriptional activator